MIYDEKRSRVLLRSGESVISPDQFALMTIKGEDTTNVYVIPSHDAEIFDYLYREDTQKELEDIDVLPDKSVTQEQKDYVIDRIVNSPRLESGMEDRVERETKYFEESENIDFLYRCVKLIDRFKENGAVWGVGRGSSCASLVMYLIEVNDINPLTYNIPFSEFSKVQEMDDDD